jgi:fatty-acyl-CoA synthase
VSKREEVSFSALTPMSFLRRSVYTFPDREAVVYDDRRYTYSQFYERIMRMASGLRKLGIGKGDKVAFLSPNVPPLLEAHYGVPWVGAILVTINIRLSPAEISHIINHSEAKVLFVDSEFVPKIREIAGSLKHVGVFVNIADAHSEDRMEGSEYEAFLSDSPFSEQEPAIDGEGDVISINYTSGTTGISKGAMYSHRGAYLNSLGNALEAGITSDSAYLWIVPMFHCNGWCFTWGVTSVGAKHVCLRRVDAARIAELIAEERITHMGGAPTVYLGLSEYMTGRNMRFPRRVKCFLGGAPPSPTLIDNIESLGGEITHSYGLTETYGPYSICEWHAEWDSLPLAERARLKARQGVPYVTSFDMRVVDNHLNEVPHDGHTMGEIVMKGNNVMLGYYKEQDKTTEAFAGGWFHSGDLAVVHPDGYVEIKDRSKDIIVSGGENISTVEIENVMYQHPDVLEVAVIAVPDEKWGEAPKAIVNPKPGRNPTREDLIAFCKERLAKFKVPKNIEFAELPRTSTGKIMKYMLKEKEWAGYDKRVH